ncbi:MAG TPA: peptide-methionine (R)-S-oxide reductase MsrB [Pinirhizobacter sp.]|uniref:peptide-methionine (R)-S-oxide reductase MsrB n=1 Tax=Pinirhizobacter sp. TaxID=2950432 RepID=UPI002C6C6E2B|nr:peptide-methionine (R)-S-oxide reductase MsrB [Pinirhizobacter sp.]HMH67264.1 peptide-methionine (R)-S-oxide reductase MsrB [Pinirhizobacter sp.]
MPSPTRRRFLGATAALAAVGILPAGRLLADALAPVQGPSGAPASKAANVTLDCFGPDKKPLGTCVESKVVMTDEAWKAKLSPLSWEVTRHEGTERAYTGPGWDRHDNGLYRCICCDTALFDSATKFDSGTGWPSFWQPISKRNVVQSSDTSLFEERTAVSCARCDAHLGHVFDDGPRPTGLRYCMNAVAMRFVAVGAAAG